MVVFDASTLILLARAGLLRDVLERTEGVISEVVEVEATRKGTEDAREIAELVRQGRLKVEKTPVPSDARKLMSDFPLQLGEASSIMLARQKRCPLATDDGPTIKACKVFEIGFLTALHFLVDLRERGVLSEDLALSKLDRLREYGRYRADIVRHASWKIRGGK